MLDDSPKLFETVFVDSPKWPLFREKNQISIPESDNDDNFTAAMEINSDTEILSRSKRHDSL